MDKYYFSYEDIHSTIKQLSRQIQSSGYNIDIIVAIGSGGFIPARILRTFIDKPILAVGISYYKQENKVSDCPHKLQWIEEAEKQLKGKNILLVDEVDDSRVTLEYCILELLQHKPASLSVAVLHNKTKEKQGKIPKEVKHYFAGKIIEDKWVCYPWDAQNIDEHTELANKENSPSESLSIHAEKKLLRKELKALLKTISIAKRLGSGLALSTGITNHKSWQDAELILAFLSMPIEINTMPVIEASLNAGKRVACPRIKGDDIEFVELDPQWKSWSRDSWGIPVPPDKDPAMSFYDIAGLACLVLVPGLGFDLHGSRIGWGKGYYDRFLAGLEKTRKDNSLQSEHFVKLGVGYSEQLLKKVPVDGQDWPLDGLALSSALITMFKKDSSGLK